MDLRLARQRAEDGCGELGFLVDHSSYFCSEVRRLAHFNGGGGSVDGEVVSGGWKNLGCGGGGGGGCVDGWILGRRAQQAKGGGAKVRNGMVEARSARQEREGRLL